MQVSYLLIITVIGAVAEGAEFMINRYQTKDTGDRRIKDATRTYSLDCSGLLFVVGIVIAATRAVQSDSIYLREHYYQSSLNRAW